MPYTIHNAISAALAFLSFEELPEKEQPPKKIWLHPKKMKQWWEEVKRLRKAELDGHGEQGEMSRNALMDDLFPGFEN